MRKIAHMINPVQVGESSDLFVAQPITFETMRIAQAFAQAEVEVSLWTALYPEDRAIAPVGFQSTPDLDRSVMDVQTFRRPRKLPLIRDIFDRLYAATDAEYLIYTNVDIALMPQFYLTVNRWLDQGYDALAINRRTLPKTYQTVADLPFLYSQLGEIHGGHDCFVFRRDAYPHYDLGNACIGSGRIGKVVLLNLMYYAQRFQELTDEHLTFHLGDDKSWKNSDFSDYFDHNEAELIRLLQRYVEQGGLPDHPQVDRLMKRYNIGQRKRRSQDSSKPPKSGRSSGKKAQKSTSASDETPDSSLRSLLGKVKRKLKSSILS